MTTLANLSTRRLTKMVDELGSLNAQISLLKRKADAIKDSLKESGYEEVFGNSYRAVIVTKTTARIDSTKVRDLLTPSELDSVTSESTSTSISLYDL